MTREVVWRNAAEQDLLATAQFLADDRVVAAAHFLDAVDQAVQNLVESPGLGRARELRAADLQLVRSWPVRGFENWLVFYRPTQRGIEVLRILHGARDLPAALGSGPATDP